MVASIMVRANIFDVRIFCQAVGRTGPCFYVGLESNCGNFFVLSNLERTKKLPEHALHCSCFNICAPAYYNHLLQRAWFGKSFNVKSDLTILFKQVFCFNSTRQVQFRWWPEESNSFNRTAQLWKTWQHPMPSCPFLWQPEQTYDQRGRHASHLFWT